MTEYLVYLGEREGRFSVNSRIRAGHKYRVEREKPFKIEPGDLWIASLEGFRVISLVNFVPTTKRIPLARESYLPKYDSAFLEGLTTTLPDPARVVEIGTGQGTSLARILYGLSLHQDAKVWTIDLVECKEAREHIQQAEVPNWRYEMIVGDSVNIAKSFTELVNMVYVDGSHTKAGVLADIQEWEHKLHGGGLMIFDDYGDPLHEVGVAVDEAMFGHPEKWEFVGRVGRLVAFEKKG